MIRSDVHEQDAHMVQRLKTPQDRSLVVEIEHTARSDRERPNTIVRDQSQFLIQVIDSLQPAFNKLKSAMVNLIVELCGVRIMSKKSREHGCLLHFQDDVPHVCLHPGVAQSHSQNSNGPQGAVLTGDSGRDLDKSVECRAVMRVAGVCVDLSTNVGAVALKPNDAA